MKAIVAENLTKRFGNFVAVNRVSFEVESGEIFGFLGANGAGKSTTIRMLIGIIEPSEGDAVVGGISVRKHPNKVKEIIGYMSQKFSLYSDLTIAENINFYAKVYGVDGVQLNKRMDYIWQTIGLKKSQDVITRDLPTGIKQKLALSIALLHKPKIVFLDEPTSGTDPISRKKFWELIQNLAEQGISIFVTTHYLDEAEYCNRIALINEGKLISVGTPAQLKNIFTHRSVYELEFETFVHAQTFVDVNLPFGKTVLFGTKLHLFCNEIVDSNVIIKFFKEKYNLKVKVRSILPSLEDVFVELLKR